MAGINPIRTPADHATALERIDQLMDAEPGTPEGRELDVLVDLVELYESKHEPMGHPSPVAAIEFRMEQAGLGRRDLVPFIGSRAKVSEILSGKRALTMPMARALHEHLGIPAEVLLRQPAEPLDDSLADIEWRRFPVRQLAKRGWVRSIPDPMARAEELMRDLIERAGGWPVAGEPLYRKSDHPRANAKTDRYALRAWCWQVLAVAGTNPPAASYARGAVTLGFLQEVAKLSSSADGPRFARELLAKRGVTLVIVPHLPKTYLDGAALRLGDGRPVVALTLRHDRIDNFWFCLLHELAHIGRHLDNDDGSAFVDDLTLRTVNPDRQDPREAEADEWAEEALVPATAWKASEVRRHPTPMAVVSLATELRVHPAVIAGRVRYERRNYRLLSQFVGTGEVRRHFADESVPERVAVRGRQGVSSPTRCR